MATGVDGRSDTVLPHGRRKVSCAGHDEQGMSVRCHYMSDLHLERQDFPGRLPHGDVLIVAGDLAHAACLSPGRTDLYAIRQRDRVRRFAEAAVANFTHVLAVAGNHDHYDGVFEDTVGLMRRHLPGFTVLDDAATEIGDVHFFGTTLWTDFDGSDPTSMERARRGVGEYFFVKTRQRDDDGNERLDKLRPHHTAAAFARARAALDRHCTQTHGRRTIVISHHAPSLAGLNALHAGNGLDGAYASALDATIAQWPGIATWVHGHTHIRRIYRVADTTIRVNCLGIRDKDPAARSFSPDTSFDM